MNIGTWEMLERCLRRPIRQEEWLALRDDLKKCEQIANAHGFYLRLGRGERCWCTADRFKGTLPFPAAGCYY